MSDHRIGKCIDGPTFFWSIKNGVNIVIILKVKKKRFVKNGVNIVIILKVKKRFVKNRVNIVII